MLEDIHDICSDTSLDHFDTMRECIGCGKEFLPKQFSSSQVRCKPHCGVEDRHLTTRDRHKPRSGDRHKNRSSTELTRPMIGIDGEGWGTNELGQQPLRLLTACDISGIVAREYNNDASPLSLEQKLEFFLSLPSDATCYLYYGNYDITQVLCGLPDAVIRELLATDNEKDRDNRYSNSYVDWNGYRLQYWPGHQFTIARSEPNPEKPGELQSVEGSVRRVLEAAGFFQMKFATVLGRWNCLTKKERALVVKGKDQRDKFDSLTVELLHYNELECRGLAELMTKLRDTALQAEERLAEQGYDIKIWPRWPNKATGAGSLGKALLDGADAPRRPVRLKKRVKGKAYLPYLPPLLSEMIERYSLFGGRFEISATGHIPGPIYTYDMNSAYPHAMLSLPCPLHTRWRKLSSRPSRGTLYLAAVQFDHPADNIWCGLPVRLADGSLCFPRQGRGVYWSVEIEAAEDWLGAEITPIPFNPDHETDVPTSFFDRGNMVETTPTIFVAEKRCDCSPLEMIDPVYAQRTALGKIAGYPLKLGLSSIAGKFGQRRGARMYRNPLAFSLVTATTRATLAKICGQFPDKVIMLATDSVHSTAPLPLETGEDLGLWKASTLKDLFVVMPGFHWSNDTLSQLKTRGMRADVVRNHVPALMKVWIEFLDKCATAYNSGARAAVAKLAGQIPAIDVSDKIFISAALALEMERQGRGKATELIGRSQLPCVGKDCDHQFCGRRQISFDWRGKRGAWRLRGATVEHRPVKGSLTQWSLPFDPEKLSGVNGAILKYGALPDALYKAPENVVEDADTPDDEKTRRAVVGI
jgi:hypothetical protein